MMSGSELYQQIRKKESFLCVGLDTDLEKIPSHLLKEEDPIFTFNKAIIDATHDLCIAYKPNIAFYEKEGSRGWDSLQRTIEYIPKDVLTIADAKRGDIGNTSEMYARTFFDTYGFDAITVAPYMGKDSIQPFLNFSNKWTIILGITSNPGSADFQMIESNTKEKLFHSVIKRSSEWGNADNTMYVVGATRGELIREVREIAPDHFFLVPGVGAQGGSLENVVKYGLNKTCGLIVNSTRGIIYASQGVDFQEKAKNEAKKLQLQMKEILDKNQNILL